MSNITNNNQSLTVYSNKSERETFDRKCEKLDVIGRKITYN